MDSHDAAIQYGEDVHSARSLVSPAGERERRCDSLYSRVGGEPYFQALVDRFYDRLRLDPALRPLYPADLEPGKANLAAFLAQYWGGPPHYSARRGHPRLRQRHFAFPIGRRDRDAWVGHMIATVRESEIRPGDADALIGYFESTATMLINRQA